MQGLKLIIHYSVMVLSIKQLSSNWILRSRAYKPWTEHTRIVSDDAHFHIVCCWYKRHRMRLFMEISYKTCAITRICKNKKQTRTS